MCVYMYVHPQQVKLIDNYGIEAPSIISPQPCWLEKATEQEEHSYPLERLLYRYLPTTARQFKGRAVHCITVSGLYLIKGVLKYGTP